MKPALRTALCERVGIELPIIQTGMGWVSGAQLTAATSEAGGLGILGSATMTLEQLSQAIERVQARTAKPFGVNLRTDQADIGARVELLIERGVRVASFAQAPSRQIIQQLKAAGVFTMPTIGARRHAEKMAEWGVDAVIAQGQEGGGHTGAVPTTLLLPQVVDAVSIPVVAAGGFFDGRGLISALAYGAAGIAMGTRFLLTRESQVPDAVKAKYLAASVTDTVVTKAIDGYPQRVLTTAIVRALEGQSSLRRWLAALVHAWRFSRLTQTSFFALVREGLALRARQELSYSQLLMAANAPMLTRASLVEGRIESGVLPTGQVVGMIEALPSVAELLVRIMAEADAALDRLSGRGTQAEQREPASTMRASSKLSDSDAPRSQHEHNARGSRGEHEAYRPATEHNARSLRFEHDTHEPGAQPDAHDSRIEHGAHAPGAERDAHNSRGEHNARGFPADNHVPDSRVTRNAHDFQAEHDAPDMQRRVHPNDMQGGRE